MTLSNLTWRNEFLVCPFEQNRNIESKSKVIIGMMCLSAVSYNINTYDVPSKKWLEINS